MFLRYSRIKLNPGQLFLSVEVKQICMRIFILTVLHGQFRWNDLSKLYFFFHCCNWEVSEQYNLHFTPAGCLLYYFDYLADKKITEI